MAESPFKPTGRRKKATVIEEPVTDDGAPTMATSSGLADYDRADKVPSDKGKTVA